MNNPAPVALVFTVVVLVLGYLAFGFWTALIFTSGFLGGFILWMCMPASVSFAPIKAPFYLTFALFILHRVEEKQMGFFNALAGLTGVPTPEIASWEVILLVMMSVGGWILVPTLVKHHIAFGDYFAWTFFSAMGITELAHFIFPLLRNEPYGYFPGMASVFFLAPSAWWGMWRLAHGRHRLPHRHEHLGGKP